MNVGKSYTYELSVDDVTVFEGGASETLEQFQSTIESIAKASDEGVLHLISNDVIDEDGVPFYADTFLRGVFNGQEKYIDIRIDEVVHELFMCEGYSVSCPWDV